jgi:hypothetical protein
MVGNENTTTNNSLQAVLFPNPNNGQFKVKLSGKQTDKIELTIIDAVGRTIKSQIISDFTGEHTETLQVRLKTGVYSLRIESGKEILSRQFIIN